METVSKAIYAIFWNLNYFFSLCELVINLFPILPASGESSWPTIFFTPIYYSINTSKFPPTMLSSMQIKNMDIYQPATWSHVIVSRLSGWIEEI